VNVWQEFQQADSITLSTIPVPAFSQYISHRFNESIELNWALQDAAKARHQALMESEIRKRYPPQTLDAQQSSLSGGWSFISLLGIAATTLLLSWFTIELFNTARENKFFAKQARNRRRRREKQALTGGW